MFPKLEEERYYIDNDYNTYSVRDELKQLGFQWDLEKKQWWHKNKAERDNAENSLLELK